jgi:hypothetical protein
MRVLIATDAWHPQVNGVVRTLTSLAASAQKLGVDVEFLSPEGFPSVPLPTYGEIRLALPGKREIARRISAAKPDAIHVATEGPIGCMVRAYCLGRRLPFTTSFTTRFPEYIAARAPIPESWGLCGAAPFPFGRHLDDGFHGLAGGRASAARIPESPDVESRR